MTEHEHKIKPNQKKHSRKKGVWRKFLTVCLCLLIFGGIVAGIVTYGGYHVYEKRADYVNRYLRSLSKDYEITIGDLTVKDIGKVEVADLRIRSKGSSDKRDIFTSPRVLVTYDWKVFNETRKLDSILIRKPSLYVDEDTFQAIKKSTETGKREGVDLKALAHFTGSFIVEEGDLFLDLPTTPPIRAKWDFRTDQLGYGSDGMTKNPFLTDLKELEIGDQGIFGKIDKIQTQWRFNSNLSKVKVEDLKLTNPTVTVMPEWLSPGAYPVRSRTVQDTVAGFDLVVDHMSIDNLDLKILGFDGKNDIKTIPDISFKSELVDWNELFYKDGRFDSKGAVELMARDIEIGGGRENLVVAQRANFRASSLREALHEGRLESVDAESAKILISDGSLSLWREKSPEQKKKAGRPFLIDRLALPDAEYLMRDFITLQSRITVPRVESQVSTVLQNVRFDKFGMHLKGVHSAELQDFVLYGPGVSEQKEPLVRLPKGHLRFDWEKAMTRNEFELLKMVDPVVSFTDEALGAWAESREYRGQNLIGPLNRPVFKFHELDITGGTLEANSRKALDGMVPKVKGTFSLSNEQIGQSLDEFGYRLEISDLQLSNHSNAGGNAVGMQNSPVPSIFPGSVIPEGESLESEEVVKVEKAFVDFTAAGIQRQRRISKVTLDGGVLRVGEGLKDVVKKPRVAPHGLKRGNPDVVMPNALRAEPVDIGQLEILAEMDEQVLTATPVPLDTDLIPIEDELEAAGPTSLDVLLADNGINGKTKRRWQIDDLEITGGKVNFDSLIPEMEGLSFGLDTKMKDIPLTAEGLLDANTLQQVRLDSLEIRDPFDSFLIVAELPDVFVEFSIAGLARQEIESIELISPVLNVGESLFRWIDYLRNFRGINEGATVDVRGANIIDEDLKKKKGGTKWVINTINATLGKLVIAPYGTPITSLPFPFSATTNVAEGKIKFEMNIDEEKTVFSLPDQGIDLIGLTGDIDFNLPIPKKSNNLVQTFRLKGGKWRKFEASDLFLTVTFDRYGIYGLFGGQAYSGYANGAFNYYLDKDGKWDAWMTGSNLNTGELTKAVIPSGFVMGGKVNTTLFSNGQDTKVNEITGALKSVGDGWFDIALMEKALEHLPEGWSGLQKGISKIAVDNLRRFDYDQGDGEVRLEGKGGEMKLRFTGEYGSRTINLHIHDWLNRKDKLAENKGSGRP